MTESNGYVGKKRASFRQRQIIGSGTDAKRSGGKREVAEKRGIMRSGFNVNGESTFVTGGELWMDIDYLLGRPTRAMLKGDA
jgi:hypothetical protein